MAGQSQLVGYQQLVRMRNCARFDQNVVHLKHVYLGRMLYQEPMQNQTYEAPLTHIHPQLLAE